VPAASTLPLVSVLVLNHNGRDHLQACLPTLAVQVYPSDRLRIEVIDNGSSDGSVEWVRANFPGVVIHRFDRNLGFAEPYDTVTRRSESEFVVFLNNDTRVEPTWVAELVSAAERHQADCVASRILDWDGRRIDFIGGTVSFIGHTWQRQTGEPTGAEPPEARLLFACGGSMLIRRQVYVDAGGFDKDFFIYFEDVDFGWRLAVLGYKTVLASKAITYHRLHGMMGKIAYAQRLRLYERNALATIYKNYDDETLRRVLPAAVSLSLARGLANSGIDAHPFTFGTPVPPVVDLTARAAVHLLAVEDFYRQLPALRRKRADIQARRRVPDREILPQFGDPFRLHDQGVYADIARTLIKDFEIEPLFEGKRVTPSALPPARPTATPDASTTRVEVGARQPSVSIIVLTALGPTHLADCLASLRAQSYPGSLRELIVVDNGSTENPGPLIEREYPGARLIRRESNGGFAVANNQGARAASGEYLAFLNDDTRAHPQWLEELVAAARRHGAASVGSRMLTWDGRHVDFAGGTVNFEGRGVPIGMGERTAGSRTDEYPTLFACGGAMLVQRDRFFETDGWDEGTFAYYEDVELGWRFWLLGHEVWLAPRSIVYHRHHGTSGRWPEPPRVRLLERNAMRMLYTHLERETLERVLPAALLLSIDRALLLTGLGRSARDATELGAARPRSIASRVRGAAANAKGALRQRGVSRRDSVITNLVRLGPRGLIGVALHVARGDTMPPSVSRRAAYQIERGAAPTALDGRIEPVPAAAAAAFRGVYDFLQELPAVSERRARFQSLRRRSDREILGRFSEHWLSPSPTLHQATHNDVHTSLVEALGIAGLGGDAAH
jgi:GT2 family glycosyltransferase